MLDSPRPFLAARATTLAVVLLAAHVATPSSAASQEVTPTAPALSGRFSGAVHGYVTEPLGDFSLNTGNGFGLGATALWKIDSAGIASLRADLGLVTYGWSNRRISFPNTGGLIQLNLNTTSSIFSFVAGPQIGGQAGPLSPYVSVLGGFSVFWTSSALEGSNESAEGNDAFATTTNLSDVVWAYGGAGGVTYRVYNGRRPVRLDFGARYLRHDDVRYLNEGRVRDAVDNDRPPIPLRGSADFVTYYFGVTWLNY
jgi:hypothetical protein